MVADGKVYVGDEDGDLVVLAANKGKKLPPEKIKPGGPENEAIVLNEVNMGAPVYSTAVIANGTMLVGTQTHLFAIAEGAKAVAPGEKK